MQTITTIGLDIAKSVFQVHGVDGSGQVIIRRQFKRRLVLAFFQKLPPRAVTPCAWRQDHGLQGGAGGGRPGGHFGARPFSDSDAAPRVPAVRLSRAIQGSPGGLDACPPSRSNA
jgi:hypothetical protein